MGNQQPQRQNPNAPPQQMQGPRVSIYHVLFFFLVFILVKDMFNKPNPKDPAMMHNVLKEGAPYKFKIEIIKNKTVLYTWIESNITYSLSSENYKKINFTLNYSALMDEPRPMIFAKIVPVTASKVKAIFGQGDLVEFREEIITETKSLLFDSAGQEQKKNSTADQLTLNLSDSSPQRARKIYEQENIEQLDEIDREFFEKNGVKKQKKEKSQPLVPHLRSKLFVQLIYDTNFYNIKQIPVQMKDYEFDVQNNIYYPPIDLSQFWVRQKHLISLNNKSLTPDTNFTIEIEFYNYWYYKYIVLSQMKESLNMFSMGMEKNDQQMDLIKEMIEDNNPYFLGITFVVSLLHSLFEFLAVKNDIHFWKNIASHKGISLRTLYFSFFTDIIIFLYLIDSQETSWLILASCAVELVLSVWKIFKTSNFKIINKFPYLKPQLQQEYIQTTQKFDKVANKWLYRALIPLFFGYSIYSLVYETYKGWYSFFLQTCVGFIYIFGFIQMTPQLYINYKLKSVDHLPWRTMIYKFLNTITDDLFAFVISMPWLRRLSCFRDDVIFIIYLYQRSIYRVDKRRTTTGFVQDEVALKEKDPLLTQKDKQAHDKSSAQPQNQETDKSAEPQEGLQGKAGEASQLNNPSEQPEEESKGSPAKAAGLSEVSK